MLGGLDFTYFWRKKMFFGTPYGHSAKTSKTATTFIPWIQIFLESLMLVWCSMVLALVVIHVLARVLPHVLARVLLHVLARVIIHVHDYYSKTCVRVTQKLIWFQQFGLQLLPKWEEGDLYHPRKAVFRGCLWTNFPGETVDFRL